MRLPLSLIHILIRGFFEEETKRSFVEQPERILDYLKKNITFHPEEEYDKMCIRDSRKGQKNRKTRRNIGKVLKKRLLKLRKSNKLVYIFN